MQKSTSPKSCGPIFRALGCSRRSLISRSASGATAGSAPAATGRIRRAAMESRRAGHIRCEADARMLLRILTAAILIPLVVALVWWGPPALLAAIAAGVAILALVEFFNLGERMGMRAFRYWTMVCAA